MSGTRKTCFVISPIGAKDSPERQWADKCLKYIFKASLEPLGYHVIRADEISETGSITHQVLGKVTESELVIADLTDHNPNVFYELAVRDTIDRPVIRVIKAEQKIPFDVADLRTIPINLDIEAVETAKAAITAQVNAIAAGNVGTTPVRIAGVLKHLESDKSEEKILLRQMIDGMSELRGEIRAIANESMASQQYSSERILRALEVGPLHIPVPRSAHTNISEQRERELIARYLSIRGVTDGNIVRKAIVELSSTIDYSDLQEEHAIEAAVNEWMMKSERPARKAKSNQP
jgi:hypothetical protein